jgi:hypothetical protein
MEGVAYVCPQGGTQKNSLVVCMKHRDQTLAAGWHEPELLTIEEAVTLLQSKGFQPVLDDDNHLWPNGETFN